MPTPSQRLHVLIAGGGVAGVEALLGLRALAGDRVDVTLLSEHRLFSEAAVALGEGFGGEPAQQLDLADVASDLGAWFVHGGLEAVDPAGHTVSTREGTTLPYDALIVATGGAAALPWGRAIVLDVSSPAMLQQLRKRLCRGDASDVVVALPGGPHWPLPGYELALLLARDPVLTAITVTLVIPGAAPLHLFGADASAAVAAELQDAGVRLVTASDLELAHGDPVAVTLLPSGEELGADAVVAVPELHGLPPEGLPTDEHGFLPVDAHGRVAGVQDVYAAGDCTAFPLKQGGLAAQQADAVVAHIAARAGAGVATPTTQVVLRARMLTGGEDLWLHRDLLAAHDGGDVTRHARWWPPAKIAGRWLAPYLQDRRDAAAGFAHPVTASPAASPAVAVALAEPADVPVPRDLDLLAGPPAPPR